VIASNVNSQNRKIFLREFFLRAKKL